MTGVAGVLAEIRPHPMVSENFPCESLAISQYLSLQSSNPLNVCSLRCFSFGYPVVLCFGFWFFLSTYRPLRYLTKLSGRSLLYTFLGMCPEKNNTTTQQHSTSFNHPSPFTMLETCQVFPSRYVIGRREHSTWGTCPQFSAWPGRAKR